MERLLETENRPLDLDDFVELAHRYLGLDVVFVMEGTAAGHVCRAVAGDAERFAVRLGGTWIETGVDQVSLVSGEIAHVIRDASSDERAASLPVTSDTRVGAFIGVPLWLSDGTRWGTFCCLSREPAHALGERDVRFISMLGELVVEDLDRRSATERGRAAIMAVLEAENVDLAYQPIFDLTTSQCRGVEVLARFPEALPGPDRTFALAERLGLGLELEELVVRKAWNSLRRIGPGQYLAVNLTPDSLLALARRANHRPELSLAAIVVEITEHRGIEAYADLRKELRQLRARALRIAVDDVGAGYASLRHVLELRPDIVKLDKWLIQGLAEDYARHIAVNSFVSLARNLGSAIVAEGVERPEDLNAARQLGLHAAQGYLLGRPSTDPEALARWTGRDQGAGCEAFASGRRVRSVRDLSRIAR